MLLRVTFVLQNTVKYDTNEQREGRKTLLSQRFNNKRDSKATGFVAAHCGENEKKSEPRCVGETQTRGLNGGGFAQSRRNVYRDRPPFGGFPLNGV